MLFRSTETKILRVKFHEKPYVIERHGDWYDLKTAEEVHMRRGDFKYISLGISVELPKGFEAIVAPRSSAFNKYGIVMTNSIGVIDEDFNGDGDIWHFPALCLWKETTIPEGTRICQFRIIEHQPDLLFTISSVLGNENRGGLGSTGE